MAIRAPDGANKHGKRTADDISHPLQPFFLQAIDATPQEKSNSKTIWFQNLNPPIAPQAHKFLSQTTQEKSNSRKISCSTSNCSSITLILCYYKGKFQCGPASVVAIKMGMIGLAHDVAFVFSEVQIVTFAFADGHHDHDRHHHKWCHLPFVPEININNNKIIWNIAEIAYIVNR